MSISVDFNEPNVRQRNYSNEFEYELNSLTNSIKLFFQTTSKFPPAVEFVIKKTNVLVLVSRSCCSLLLKYNFISNELSSLKRSYLFKFVLQCPESTLAKSIFNYLKRVLEIRSRFRNLQNSIGECINFLKILSTTFAKEYRSSRSIGIAQNSIGFIESFLLSEKEIIENYNLANYDLTECYYKMSKLSVKNTFHIKLSSIL
jgi:hypothetical protein